MTKLKVWVLLVSWGFAGPSIPELHAEDCASLKANSNVLQISRDGVKRDASGVLLTYDGYIITAAHPLSEGLEPPHPLNVFARIGSSDWQSARVKRVDQVLDLALLKLGKIPEPFAAVRAADDREFDDAKTRVMCLSGFGIHVDARGARTENKFLSVRADSQGSQLGYMYANRPIELGYSGGAAFVDGELAGLILRKDTTGTFIIPISYIVEFVAPEGIFLNADRSFEPGVVFSQMAQMVENNRRNTEKNRLEIKRIYRSINWIIEYRKGDGLIVLTPKPAFPDQVIEGTFIGELTAYFEGENFKQFVLTNDPKSIEVGGAISKKGLIEIGDLNEKLALIRAKYGSEGVRIERAKLTKFIIKGWIYFDEFKGGPFEKEIGME